MKVELAEIRMQIVAEFIEYCKENDVIISDKIFESFFGA